MRIFRCVLISLAFLSCGALAQAQSISRVTATVTGDTVTYQVQGCPEELGSSNLYLYRDLPSAPTTTSQADQTKSVGGQCADKLNPFTVVWPNAPLGLFKSWFSLSSSSVALGAVHGPVEVCVGPDVVLHSFTLEKNGASLTYVVRLCNIGSMPATKFRVGFWHDESAEPPVEDMGVVFQGIKVLQPGECYDADGDGKEDPLRVSGGLRPNGDFVAWARVDSGDFVEECREGNNTPSSAPYQMRNPDLYIKSSSARVTGRTVTYSVEVCNKGAAGVPKFFVDVYYHRPEKAPTFGEPGDEALPVANLAPQQCTALTFTRPNTPDGEYTSYIIIDPDDFISEPDEGNNYGQPLAVQVGEGSGPKPDQELCIDRDKDGHGVGPGCTGVPDSDDTNAAVNPSQKEVCGDGLDNDSDYTIDDGCPGVDCIDTDGDGWGVGKDCVIADPDDGDKEIYPWAPTLPRGTGTLCVDADKDGWGVGPDCRGVPDCNDADSKQHPGVGQEKCGDAVDNDCDFTVDDGCPGVACVDGDGDGWGVGADCLMQDPDDGNASIYPYSQCVDKDGDGYGVGSMCKGVPDCNDNDKAVHPGVAEICGNNLDDDCDLTIDDGCPGIDCVDKDGDSFGVGKDCVLADCDDADKSKYPFAPEICGDNKDDNCNGIADDGCRGRHCIDLDMDGFGVGRGCPGPQDCQDNDRQVRPGAEEACGDGLDNDCDGVPEDGCDTNIDGDGDGVGVGGAVDGQPDCNDTDKKIHPGANEICGDGVDNDCDGTVDDGCAGVSCTDGDGDGWGTGADCKVVDCDDRVKAVHPYAKEICGDGVDNDCDGTVDDGCPGVACVDGDGDGWGVGADCKKEDCDDTDAGTHPWVVEICEDDKDNNCNGSKDEGCMICDDKDGDGHGIGPRCSSWDCDDNNLAVHPGAEEVCDLLDNDCNGEVPPPETECALADAAGCGCYVRGDSAPLSPWFWFGLGLLGLLALRRCRSS